jgi:hypothetical protein
MLGHTMPRKINVPEKPVVSGQYGILDLHNKDLLLLPSIVRLLTGTVNAYRLGMTRNLYRNIVWNFLAKESLERQRRR